ncbi:hypothetical protein V6N13_101461 [Hibiscus sabdariffa]
MPGVVVVFRNDDGVILDGVTNSISSTYASVSKALAIQMRMVLCRDERANCSFKISQTCEQATTWLCRHIAYINTHQPSQQIKTHTEFQGIACSGLDPNITGIRDHNSGR